MKKSELRQIIKEELKFLLESEVVTTKYEFSHGKKPKGTGSWIFKIGSEEWKAPGRINYSDAVVKAKEQAKEKGVTKIEVMP